MYLEAISDLFVQIVDGMRLEHFHSGGPLVFSVIWNAFWILQQRYPVEKSKICSISLLSLLPDAEIFYAYAVPNIFLLAICRIPFSGCLSHTHTPGLHYINMIHTHLYVHKSSLGRNTGLHGTKGAQPLGELGILLADSLFRCNIR